MGRSVSRLSNAAEVIYFDVSRMGFSDYDFETGEETGNFQYDEFQGQEDWNDFIEGIRFAFANRFKSVRECDRWEDREDHIVAESNFVEIGVAEYCGLASVSIRVRDELSGLAETWVRRTWPNIEKAICTAVGYPRLNRMGTVSNGHGVFSRADEPGAVYDNADRII